MARLLNRFLFIFICVAFPVFLAAQSNAKLGDRFSSNWFLGLSAGPTFFSGDLNTNRFLPQSGDWRFAGTFFFGRQISHVFSLRGQVLFGKVAGRKETKQDGTPVNLSFTSTVVDGNFNTMINFSNLIGGYNPKRSFFVYGTVGIGAGYWKTTQRSLLTNEVALTSDSVGRITAMIPAGIGAYYSIANKVNLGLEWTLRTLTSDMLDGVAEGFRLDMYSLLSFNVTLNLGKPAGRKTDPVDYRKDGPIVLNLPKCNPLPVPSKQNQMGMDKLPPPPSVAAIPAENYLYKVQIFAFAQHIYSAGTIQKRYHIPMSVSREYSNSLYRFTVGSTQSLEEARDILNRMRNAGISDAFIVAYDRNGERTGWREPMQ
ncbi:MAG: SPOR domain-containing protein [Bacteroidetes bacterium]|nr:MAG: SPOR domain-containing protein [Bacteroidota bacterium]